MMEILQNSLGCKENTVVIGDEENVSPMNPGLVPSPRKMMGFVYKRRKTIRNSVSFITDQTTERVTTCKPTPANERLVKQEIGNGENGSPKLDPPAIRKPASPSSVEVIEVKDDSISAKTWCISTMMAQGLISREPKSSEEGSMCGHVADQDQGDLEQCKVCGVSDSLGKMLICDSCDGAFHLSCCYPKIKKIPRGWWHCRHCKTKNRKALAKFVVEDSDTSAGSDIVRNDAIFFMLKDTEPYTTQVRIGKEFQAEVPEWIGPGKDEPNNLFHGTPLETSCKEHKPKQWNKDTSIGNWLQCQNDISDESATSSDRQRKQGSICGKWRRAPLFEVQTSDWECFSAVLWDPSHADCAVPQELSTDEVLKHLKFIETLKARLAGKSTKYSALNCQAKMR